MHALAKVDDKNPALDFFDRLVNPIQYGDPSNNNNKDNARGLAGVENNNNKNEEEEISGMDDQEEIPGVETLEEEE